MMRLVFAAIAAAFLVAGPAPAQQAAELVPAERFVDPVSARSAQISPNGAYVAYIQRTDTHSYITVIDLAGHQARQVQVIPEEQGGYNWVRWKGDDRLVASATIGMGSMRRGVFLYAVTRVLTFDRDGSDVKQLFEGQMNRLMGGYGSVFYLDELHDDPENILVTAWDSGGTGVWRANVHTGRVERVADGSNDTNAYITDGAGYPVMRRDSISNGRGYRFYRRANGARDWITMMEARRAQAVEQSPDFAPLGPGPGANQVYVLQRAADADLMTLHILDTSTGQYSAPLQQNASVDSDAPWVNPRTRQLFATCEFAERQVCRAQDARTQRHLTAIDRFFEGGATVNLINMSADGARWLLHVDGPQDPGAYYVYEPANPNLEPVIVAYPNIDTAALSPTEVVSYASRDGTQLWAYVTRPRNATGPLPMVVMPHGGPEARDYYGYDAYTQFLASRGYVVVQPNFRGSSGSGRAFADAGRRQWGRRMQDDVTDAVQHMIASGTVDRERICIVGASYGGYAALTGVALTPDLYKCAISIAGVSDLIEILRSESRTRSGSQVLSYIYWVNSIGDRRENSEELRAVSARHQVGNIRAPILLMHGVDDYVVEIRQSELMQEALNGAGKPTRLVRFEDEGHYWDNWSREHRLELYHETERFLAEHIGGASSAPPPTAETAPAAN